MNQSSDDAWLIAIGAAVSDGGGVDWDEAESQAASPEQRHLVEGLRRLATVVDAHRQLPQDAVVQVPDAGSAPLTQVTHWRHLVLFERIGAGAFGTVHRGWDSVLDRDVAVKLLTAPRAGAASPLDEARHLARVRHANVVVVHGADEEGGTSGIWMEFIEGQTLAQIVGARGPMSAREATGIGLDLCGALSAIHAAGLLHRDIKAQNVMREVGGRIVLMDFSGAHALRSHGDHRLVSGTPLYMAPELLRGAGPTPATDVYSLGVLLFFLLCGRLPVEGATLDEVRQAHAAGARQRLRDLRADLPDGIVRVVERAVAPDVAHRLHTAGELEHALMHASGVPAVAVGGSSSRGRWAGVWLGALVLGLLSGALFLTRDAPQAGPPLLAHFTIDTPLVGGSWPRVSPDGRLIVYGAHVNGRLRFWVRPLDRLAGEALPHGHATETPFWSPDSTSLGYFEEGKLKRMSVDDGEPRVLADAPRPRGGAWIGNTILFARDDGVYRVSASGGDAVRVTTIDRKQGDRDHGWPAFLPDGERFLFIARSGSSERDGLFVGSVDGGTPRRVMDVYSRTTYADGQLLYVRDGALVAQPFDAQREAIAGEPAVIAARVTHHLRGDAAFDVSSTGVLIYNAIQSPPSSRLVLFDRRGREVQVLTEIGWFGRPRFSPDGQRVAVEKVSPDDNEPDLWVYGIKPRSAQRLTTHPAPDVHPVWSPDGQRIAFSSRRRHVWDVFVRTVDARNEEEVLFALPGDQFVEHWSPDGRFLTWAERLSGLWLAPIGSGETPVQIRAGESALQWQSEFSPDGRWLAYMSAESGKPEVYVEPFPATGARWQISTSGGTEPHWRGDGKELLYLDAECTVTAVPVNGTRWHASPPQPLFKVEVPESAGANYSMSPDGRFLVVNAFVSDPVVQPIDVVLNWGSLVK